MKAKEKRRVSDEEFERQYAELQKAKPQPELLATEAYYDPQRKNLVVKLQNGSTIITPISALSEFRGASEGDIAAVKLRPRGTSLHWERLDQDFTVGGLIASVLGREALMKELGRRGGSVSTDAKASAARVNGRKGGRPPLARAAAAAVNSLTVQAVTVHADRDHIDIAVTGGSQQSVRDLARYETGLIAAQGRLLGLSASISSAGVLVDKPDFLVHAVASLSGEMLEEADDDAELPVAA